MNALFYNINTAKIEDFTKMVNYIHIDTQIHFNTNLTSFLYFNLNSIPLRN